MSLNLRIFLANFSILGVATYLLLNVFISELRPGMRQTTEDTLVDTANLLAEVVSEEFQQGTFNQQSQLEDHSFARSIDRFLARSYRAKIFSVDKESSQLRIYITDDQGKVVYDSTGKDLGADYSQWNDVYLTLRGQYGARSTKLDPTNELSTVMHVAAPIQKDGQIIGSLTVAKPNQTVQPFIDLALLKIKTTSFWLIVISIVIGAVFSFGLTRSIRKLVDYADSIANGRKVPVPKVGEVELTKLADAIENMREQLEGKAYVENYVHGLTHELKSPVSAIKGAAELLSPTMKDSDFERFQSNILDETDRIDVLINRLLALASLEKRGTLENTEPVSLPALVEAVVESKRVALESKDMTVDVSIDAAGDDESVVDGDACVVDGDAFLLSQVIDNLLQNALEFSPQQSVINISIATLSDGSSRLQIIDQGPGIPDYALPRVFERFYSLNRPDTHKKSTGLGLCFVKEIVELHHGHVVLENDSGSGCVAQVTWPK
ncbi:two-component system sensor histidine kinase CreC [Litoribrevibacter albus]|uniref:histidine kinase n=1 Tax=Litoribrevibacter albus TaxID=1473156 RepID=A0AA37WA79_9GAMM|nr:two-component system sensor histidine kinase CreC [Litoribrevibacter albus]GLQ33356.1 sensor histidine kinase [Litoribrevibacter albus]